MSLSASSCLKVSWLQCSPRPALSVAPPRSMFVEKTTQWHRQANINRGVNAGVQGGVGQGAQLQDPAQQDAGPSCGAQTGEMPRNYFV